MTTPRREIVACLSLANLCFLGVWAELLGGTRRIVRLRPFAPADYLGVLIDTLLLAALFWLAARFVRRLAPAHGGRLVRAAFVLAALVPLNTVRAKLALAVDPIRLLQLVQQKAWVGLVLASAVVLAALAARQPRTAFRMVRAGVILLFPFFLVTAGRALWRAADSAATPWRPPVIAGPVSPPRSDGPRVVWLLFDEMDEKMAFTDRPATVALPELDRLRAVSWHAAHAEAVANTTLTAVPTLLTGQRLAPETDTRLPGPPPGASNVFSRARADGFDVRVSGWAYPYCRIFGESLSTCTFQPVFVLNLARTPETTLFGAMTDAAASLLPWNSRRIAIRTYETLLARARDLVTRPGAGLVYAHLSVPHAPVIYDRFRGHTTTVLLSGREGYLHNLALADRTLGDLRRAMEQAGLWAGSTVLVTADHPWREAPVYERRAHVDVPLLVKLAGQERAVEHDAPFSAMLTGDLVTAVLRGEIARPEDISPWIARRPPT